jgi:hypothetical protein
MMMAAERVTARDYVQLEQSLMRSIASVGEADPRREDLVDELWALRHAVTASRCPTCSHRIDRESVGADDRYAADASAA